MREIEKWIYKPLSRPVWDGTTNHELVFYPYLIPPGIIKMCIKSSLKKREYKGDFSNFSFSDLNPEMYFIIMFLSAGCGALTTH